MKKFITHFFLIILIGALHSASAKAIFFQQGFGLPEAPKNVSAEALSHHEIAVSWEYDEDEEKVNHFFVHRAKGSSSIEFEEVFRLNKHARLVVDESLDPATTYRYRVIANNPDGDSEPSNIAEETTLMIVPNPPTGLTASPLSSTEIKLDWTHDGANYTNIVVEKSLSESGPFTEAAVLATNIFTYLDSGLEPSTTYYYRVIALNGTEPSSPSNIASATTQALLIAPAAPSGLQITSKTSSIINLEWTDNADNETGFVLERSTTSASSGFTVINEPAANTTTYQDNGLTPNTTYYYRIKAINAVDGSAYSSISGTTDEIAPAAPSGLQITGKTSSTINLEWTDNANNETGFVLERSTTSATTGFTVINEPAANTTTYQDDGLTPNITYYYRIKSRNAEGDSGYSATSGKTNDVAPAAPSGLQITGKTASSIILGWTDNSTNETAFVLERSATSASAGFVEIKETAANIISFEDTGLASNTTYYYRVKAINTVGDSEYSATSGKTNDVAPVAPSGLQITSKTAHTITLNWTDNSNNEANFILEKSVTSASSGFSLVATLPVNTTTYEDTELASNTTYYYRVQATNTAGESAYSATSGKTDTDLPLTPTNLTVVEITTSSIALTWTDNSNNETGFEVVRSLQGSTGFTLIAELPANSKTFLDEGLESNTTYFYKVRAVNSDGASPYGNTVSPTTEREAGPPTAPSMLKATAITTFQINLTWQDNSDNETSFVVERSTSEAGPFEIVTSNLPANTEFYENTGLQPNTTYFYRVRAKNIDGAPVSNVSSATTLANPTPPTAPTGLSAVAVSTVQINLTWTDNSNSETYFTIQRANSLDGPFTLIGTVGANVTSFPNFGLTPNTTYYYRVRAENGDGVSAFSNIDNAKTSQAPQPPSAPSSLTAVGVSTTQINLSWTDNSNSETGFVIERASSIDGTYSFVGSVGANTTIYQNTGLNANTTYFYKVRAINNDGTSGYSNITSAKTLAEGQAPTSPSNLVANGVSTTQINLTWEDNSVSETNFEIHRSSTEDGTYTFLVNVAANKETYENTGLQPNTTYYYKIRASNGDGSSSFSNIAVGTTSEEAQPPADPDGLTALPVSTTQITLQWNDKAFNETVYEIERYSGSGEFTLIGTVDANDTLFQNFGLSPNTEYVYRVRAQNEDGVSSYSNEATATTFIDKVPPLAPSDLFGKLVSQNEVELFWTDNSINEEEFIVERAELETANQSDANFTIVEILPSNTTNFTDTDLKVNSIYRYRIQAKNSDGNSFSNEITLITSISGNPIIVTTKINYPAFISSTTSDTTVSIEVAEPELHNLVTFNFRGITDDEFTQKDVEINGNTYSVSLIPEHLDEMGVEYYFEATDQEGNISVSTTGYTHWLFNDPGLLIPEIKVGGTTSDYQMIAIPLNLERNNIVQVFEDNLGPYDPSKWRLFHYENGTMLEKGDFNTIEPGQGYWLITLEAEALNTGEGRVLQVSQSKPYVLNLKQGWNQIGNPYLIDINWSRLLAANNLPQNPAIFSPLYTFSDQYNESTVLKIFQGAYLHSEKDTSIVVPLNYSEINNGGRFNNEAGKQESMGTNIANQPSWMIDFNLSSGSMEYSLGGLGMHANANESKDQFDRIALPRLNEFLDIRFEHPEHFSSNFTKDVVPLQNSFVWDMKVNASSGNNPVTLSWQKSLSIPNGKNLILFDSEQQKRIDMGEQSSYKVSGEEVKLQVYYGDDNFIEENVKAKSISVGIIYPNPFSEAFNIPLSLPESISSYNISIKLYNSVGNEVIEPLDFELEKGFRNVEISESSIQNLDKGVYFYRIIIGQEDKILKEASGKILKK